MHRRSRRIRAVDMLLVLVVLAGGFHTVQATGHGETDRLRPLPGEAAPRILVVPGGVGGGAWGAMRDGIVTAAGDLGLRLEIPEVAITPAARTRDEQINLLEGALVRGFGAALVVPADTEALRPYAEDARAAGIPFVAAGDRIGETGPAVLHDQVTAAEWLARRIRARRGDRATVAMIRGPDGLEGTVDAVRAALTVLAPEVRLLPPLEPSGTDSIELVVEELAFAYPDLQVLIVDGGESLVAAARRTRFSPNLLVVGVGTGSAAIDLWETGAVDLLVLPDLWGIGYSAVETLERLRRGEAVPPVVTVPGILLEDNSSISPRMAESLRRVDR